jgi:hypothetical protein
MDMHQEKPEKTKKKKKKRGTTVHAITRLPD